MAGKITCSVPTDAGAQAYLDRTRVTMHAETSTRSWERQKDEESAGGMRRVWNGHSGGSRVTIAAHGRRCERQAVSLPA